MKIVILFLALIYTGLCNAQFISNDGEYHVAAGALISGATYTIIYSKTKNKSKAFWYSLGASALAGIAKEAYDSTKSWNKFDSADATATVVGGLTASVTLSLFVGKKKKNNKIAFVN